VRSGMSAGAGLIMTALVALVLSCWPGQWALSVDPVVPGFHVLEEEKAYRSAQPAAHELEAAIELLGIRTVVNLRGTNLDEPWYQAEAAVCEAAGVALVDHAMSARSLPSAELLEEITDTLLTARYPILIHCQGGADRTGAISAIYRMLIMGDDKADALAELSPAYFHFRAFTPCMDTLIELYEPGPEWLAQYAATVDDVVCTP